MRTTLMILLIAAACTEPQVATKIAQEGPAVPSSSAPGPVGGDLDAKQHPQPRMGYLSPGARQPLPVDHSDIVQACVAETKALVEDEGLRRVITQHCLRRAHKSTRSGRYRSKIDDTLGHDRDRPYAWRMYDRAVGAIWLDPLFCEAHRVQDVKHPRACRLLARKWSYNSKLTDSARKAWMSHSHDVERFGTRGPIDMNPAFHSRYLGPCIAPEQFDRNDVSARVHALRALDVCSTRVDGRCTLARLREAW